MLTIIQNLLGLATVWKGYVFAGAVALAIGAASGWATRDYLCDAAAAHARARAAERKLAAITAATEGDVEKVIADLAELAQLKEKADAIEAGTAVRECLGADDVTRLRSLWQQ